MADGSNQMIISGTLRTIGSTLMADGSTWTVDGSTQTVGGGTLMSVRETQTVESNTLMFGGGTLMSNDQHLLDSSIANTTRSRHHQAKQHLPVCLHKVRIQSCTLHVVELDSIRTIARRVQVREENLYFLLTLLFSFHPIFICGSD
jgi:hypothetical protein